MLQCSRRLSPRLALEADAQMNKDLAEVIKLYAMGSHKDLNAYLLDKSKDTLIALLTDLVTMYINGNYSGW